MDAAHPVPAFVASLRLGSGRKQDEEPHSRYGFEPWTHENPFRGHGGKGPAVWPTRRTLLDSASTDDHRYAAPHDVTAKRRPACRNRKPARTESGGAYTLTCGDINVTASGRPTCGVKMELGRKRWAGWSDKHGRDDEKADLLGACPGRCQQASGSCRMVQQMEGHPGTPEGSSRRRRHVRGQRRESAGKVRLGFAA